MIDIFKPGRIRISNFMEIFNAIGLPFLKGKTLNDLAADAEKLGEASISARTDCTLYGHCWRIGAGLEVWTILYESASGETFYAGCRPGFRARYAQNIEKWSLYEDCKEGEAAVRGFIENSSAEVFFQLQNLTEISPKNFDRETLRVALGGLAVRAEISGAEEDFLWQPLRETPETIHIEKTYRRLCGKIRAFETLRNPHSEKDLYWIYLALENFDLEILVNQKDLRGSDLRVGSFVKADVWLQGHIVSRSTRFSHYEGVDWSASPVDFWKHFKRQN